MEWLILGLILLYAGWVIYRKVKNLRQGKFGCCGCSDCSMQCSKNPHCNERDI